MTEKLINLFVLLIFTLVPFEILAYETDQYSTLFYPLNDSTQTMDNVVNDAIEHVVNNWNKERNDYSLLSRIAGFFHSRQLEKWVNESSLIDSRNVKSDSIFKTTGWKNSIIIQWKGLASSFTLNDIQIGSDKLSHFFGVGWIFWKISERDNAGNSEAIKRKAVVDEGIFTEQTYWGRSSTNVFSNADLVTNWEGYIFYRSILEDNILEGKKAIIRWEGDRPVIQRKFTFRDHVNDFWSEALLPNDYDPSLARNIKNVLMSYCEREEYIQNSSRWVSKNYQHYWKKYIFLGIKRNAIKFRMDTICSAYYSMSNSEKSTFKIAQEKREGKFKEDTSDGDFRILDLIPFVKTTIERIDSAVPTCNIEIEKAKNEHIMTEDFYNKYTEIMMGKLNSATKKTFKKNNLNNTEIFFNDIFNKINKKKIREKKFNNLVLRRITKNIKIKGNTLKVIAEYSNYGDNNVKACIILPMPFEKSPHPVRHDYVKSSNYHCAYINKNTGEMKTAIFWRAYNNDKKLRSSLESYYGILDQEAYIYRMIPKFCKWY